ncbi:MAG: DMT family transporter [Desulfovibrio sp.]
MNSSQVTTPPSTDKTCAETNNFISRFFSKGVWHALQATFWFSVGNVCVKYAGQELPFMEVVFGRALMGLFLSFFLMRKLGVGTIFGKNKALLMQRGIFGFIGMACSFHAMTHLPLTDAMSLFYTNPIWGALLAFIILGERLCFVSVFCIFASLGGVVLVARPSFLFDSSLMLDPVSVIICLVGAMFAGLTYVVIRKIHGRENPLTVVLYLYLIATPVSFITMWGKWVMPDLKQFAALILLGIFTQIAQVNLVKAIAIEKTGVATSVINMQVVFAAIWGFLIFSEIPSVYTLCGGALIVGSTIFVGRDK